MRSLIPFAFYAMMFVIATPSVMAQLSVPFTVERHGITVFGSETVNLPADMLRGFITIKATDAEPKQALVKLHSKKQLALEIFQKCGAEKTTLKSSGAHISELHAKTTVQSMFSPSISILSPPTQLDSYTAAESLSFDLLLRGKNDDEIVLLPHEICERIRASELFDSDSIQMLYVGKVNPNQSRDAMKSSIDQAKQEARVLAELAGVSLGKLVAMNSQNRGTGSYWTSRSNIDTAISSNPLAYFQPADDEVLGIDPQKLSATYSVELRYDLKLSEP